MTDEEPKNEKVNVRVSASVRDKLVSICKRLDRSQGWVISDLISKEFERMKRRKKKKGSGDE